MFAAVVKRSPSPELGDGDFVVTNRYGRPLRKSAGKKLVLEPGYVDSSMIDQQLLELAAEDVSEPESEFDTDVERERAKLRKKAKKRKRSPSPLPPPLSPMPPPDLPSAEGSPEPFSLIADDTTLLPELEPISLTFNIEKGFSGPLRVQLDLNQLTRPQKRSRSSTSTLTNSSSLVMRTTKSRSHDPLATGFLSLPAELRTEVYRLIFKTENKIDFVEGNNMPRSAAFLRTCRRVYEEGRHVLYGSNTFYFARNKEMRRPFWIQERKEIGYKDMRLFFDLIGTSNVSLIRSMWICFDDAAPSTVPHLRSQEARRYVHDGHLIEALKFLAKHGRLQKLQLTFWGRRTLASVDFRFLKYLTRLRADQVETKTINPYYHPPNKICEDVRVMIKTQITRKHKLYPD